MIFLIYMIRMIISMTIDLKISKHDNSFVLMSNVLFLIILNHLNQINHSYD